MLQLQAFTFNPFSENTFLLTNNRKQCWIVDPGMCGEAETAALLGYLRDNELQPQAIINTHTHIDHILGVQALTDAFGIPFCMHEQDLPVLANARGSAMLFGLQLAAAPVPSRFISGEEPLLLGEDRLEVRLTPGHSPGSISFYFAEGGWVLGGDVLFAGSIGRTDLPGGNYETLIHSIRTQLLTLPEETVVYAGHGPATTIGQEERSNPFLAGGQ